MACSFSNCSGGSDRPTRKSANGRARPNAVTESSNPITSDARESGMLDSKILLRIRPIAAMHSPITRRAVLENHGAHDGVAGADNIAPHAQLVFLGLSTCLPHALQPGSSISCERYGKNDPCGQATGDRMTCLEPCNSQSD